MLRVFLCTHGLWRQSCAQLKHPFTPTQPLAALEIALLARRVYTQPLSWHCDGKHCQHSESLPTANRCRSPLQCIAANHSRLATARTPPLSQGQQKGDADIHCRPRRHPVPVPSCGGGRMMVSQTLAAQSLTRLRVKCNSACAEKRKNFTPQSDYRTTPNSLRGNGLQAARRPERRV